MLDKTGGIELPYGRSALSKEEISKLRINIGKSHRTEKDWTIIKKLFEDRAVFTVNPADEKIAKQCCIEGVLKNEGALIVFTSVESCTDYLNKIGTHRFGRYMTIGNIPFNSVIEIALNYKEMVYVDPNDPVDMKILGVDGRTRAWHVYALMKP